MFGVRLSKLVLADGSNVDPGSPFGHLIFCHYISSKAYRLHNLPPLLTHIPLEQMVQRCQAPPLPPPPPHGIPPFPPAVVPFHGRPRAPPVPAQES